MLCGGMAEHEHPGIFVEESEGKGGPIDGVPTNALTARDRRRWVIGLAIGAIVLTGLGFWFAR